MSKQWLEEVGIRTVADLQRLGPVAAYRIVKRKRSGVSLNLLWALAASLKGIDWRELSESEKDLLRLETESC